VAGPTDRDVAVESLLAEQVDYYRALAPDYHKSGLSDAGGEELEAALDAFAPNGRVLEIACGTGIWTAQLARHADSLTAVDASPEMIAIARTRVADERVRFIHSSIFDWVPDGRYDAVVFGFWLSHVPLERFARFWEIVASALEPQGRVFFVDDAHRTPDELLEGESGSTVRRLLRDGSAHRLYKVAHTPERLEARLAQLGWDIRVSSTSGPFFWGEGTPPR
jgi:2-polyprenyl-3-methyl-5-hydroxy-6-metoxy-1,4-benzoquinol methylase